MVIVVDRPDDQWSYRRPILEAYRNIGFPVKLTFIRGEPGWKGPATAWNRGFQHAVDATHYYCFSSEVVQDSGNIQKTRELLERHQNTAVFGSCHNSEPTNEVIGAEPGLLVSTRMPRPLGFIVGLPTSKVKEIGGFDEDFMQGYWYDDDDFFYRLWQSGVDFLFHDPIHGIHLHHDRPVLSTHKGQAGIERNRKLMEDKHQTTNPWKKVQKIELRNNLQTLWKHP